MNEIFRIYTEKSHQGCWDDKRNMEILIELFENEGKKDCRFFLFALDVFRRNLFLLLTARGRSDPFEVDALKSLGSSGIVFNFAEGDCESIEEFIASLDHKTVVVIPEQAPDSDVPAPNDSGVGSEVDEPSPQIGGEHHEEVCADHGEGEGNHEECQKALIRLHFFI